MVIYILCVRFFVSGYGKLKIIMEFIDKYVKEWGYKVICFDIYEGNILVVVLYFKIGYNYVGIIKVYF